MTTVQGPTLFRRVCNVTVGSLLLDGFDVEFKVRKNLKQEPNTCDLRIYDLSPDHRKALEQASAPTAGPAQKPGVASKVVPVRIDAGYVGAVSQIFLGELRASQSIIEGGDIITELSTGDGDAAKLQRINVPIGPGTSQAAAMRALLGALGIGQGNLARALQLLQTKGSATAYAKGALLKGAAADHMTDLCRGAGLEWSIQDGQLQVLNLGQPLDGQAILLDSDHGLVGSATVDTKGILSATALMIPGLKPGVKVSVNSVSVKGGYRVISCEYSGNTKETEWYCRVEADRY